jgi:BA14K-like protein
MSRRSQLSLQRRGFRPAVNPKNLEPSSSSLENDMRSKLLGSAAAMALTAGAILASSAPASAQRWHGPGFWPGAVAAGIVGGAVAAATSPLWAPGYYDYYPGYAYAPYGYSDTYAAAPYGYSDTYATAPYGYSDTYATTPYGYSGTYAPPLASGTVVAQGGSVAWCQAHYRSYDPASGTYLGFDGMRHVCP